MGEFYICAVPIGNLGDITLRALEILKKADFILCEDTRVTGVLLEKYGIKSKLISCHKFNEKEISGKIIRILNEGNTAVLVSDAGTPLISDPGGVLIQELLKNNIKITSLPGACAVPVFLSLLPRDKEEFAFIGFIPRTQQQQIEILNKYKNTNCVFYDSPLRLMKTLENIASAFGSETKISIARELTKVFEEVKTGAVSEIIEYYKTHALKGEIAAMVYARAEEKNDPAELKEKAALLKKEGYSAKDISKILALLYGANKNQIYKMITKEKEAV